MSQAKAKSVRIEYGSFKFQGRGLAIPAVMGTVVSVTGLIVFTLVYLMTR